MSYILSAMEMLQLGIAFSDESIKNRNFQLKSIISGYIIDRKQLLEFQSYI